MLHKSLFLLLVLASLVTGCASAESTAPDPTVIPYSNPGAQGPYPVGVRTIILPKGDGSQDVPVEVWYPAAEVSATTAMYRMLDMDLVPSIGYRDVQPATDAPLLLVVFSHGFGGIRWQNYTMAERLASFGFVVAAPDHPGSTVADLGNFGHAALNLAPRPGTVMRTADALWQGAVPGLQPRGSTYALVGHSMGALTALVMGGAVIVPSQYEAECAKANHDGGCDIVGPMTDVTPGVLASMPPPDTRIQTMVVQNPAGTYALDSASLQHLPHALLMSGDKDGFYKSGAVAAFEKSGPGTEFVTYTHGGHNGPTDICTIPAAKAIAPDCKGAADGYVDPNVVRDAANLHVVAWLGVYFGQQPAFQQHLATGPGFSWQVK